MFTIQLFGTHVIGKTCHLTILLIICLNKGGKGSTSSSLRIPGGFPFLSCNMKFSTNTRKTEENKELKSRKTVNYHCIVITTTKLYRNTTFTTHPFPRFWIRTFYKYSKCINTKSNTAIHANTRDNRLIHSKLFQPKVQWIVRVLKLIYTSK